MKEKAKEEDLRQIVTSSKRSSWKGKFILLILLLAFLGSGYFYYTERAGGAEKGPEYLTEEIKSGDVALTITTTGTLEPTNQVTLGSELSGTALEVYVDSNDQVTKGQALAKLDTTKFAQLRDSSSATLSSAKATVSQTKATLKESQAKLARYEELHRISEGRTPAKADMDTAIAAVERSQADLESAEAKVSQAEADLISKESDLSKTIIRSPVDGVVLTRSLEEGQTVAAQFQAPELFIIAEDLSKMELLVNVAEADIGRLTADQPATFTVDAWPNRTYKASVNKVSYGSTITDNVVTYETELEVANEDLTLRPGMTATSEITVAEVNDVLIVPNAALRFSPKSAAPAGEKAEKEKGESLIGSLTPGPPRRKMGGGKSGGGKGGEGRKPSGKSGPQFIWILKDGKAVQIRVETGITDGRFTEVSGPEVSEGMKVIVSESTPQS
ncbi:MAG: efflux RND transporter periplasmic adaptor subunit [Akkermansiaceae bacterium]